MELSFAESYKIKMVENIRGISALAKRYGVKLMIDSARFAESAPTAKRVTQIESPF